MLKKNIEVTTKKFIKRFGYCISKCFKKVRIKGTQQNRALENLFNQRRILRNKTDEASAKALDKVNAKLSELCAEDNLKLIQEACKGMSCEEGGMNPAKFWKLKKKLRGIISEPPTAMQYGNLVTSSSAIEELTVKMYEEGLKAHKGRTQTAQNAKRETM